MTTIKLPHFGMLDAAALDEYYDVNIDFNNKEIQIDLNFENRSIDIKRLDLAKQFIENLRIHDINNKKFIQADFDNKNGDTVRPYITSHLEELASDDIDDLVGSNTKSSDRPARLVSKLHLVRLGLFPDREDEFATFDYSIGQELTNYLVVINTDENGNLLYITVES